MKSAQQVPIENDKTVSWEQFKANLGFTISILSSVKAIHYNLCTYDKHQKVVRYFGYAVTRRLLGISKWGDFSHSAVKHWLLFTKMI